MVDRKTTQACRQACMEQAEQATTAEKCDYWLDRAQKYATALKRDTSRRAFQDAVIAKRTEAAAKAIAEKRAAHRARKARALQQRLSRADTFKDVLNVLLD